MATEPAARLNRRAGTSARAPASAAFTRSSALGGRRGQGGEAGPIGHHRSGRRRAESLNAGDAAVPGVVANDLAGSNRAFGSARPAAGWAATDRLCSPQLVFGQVALGSAPDPLDHEGADRLVRHDFAKSQGGVANPSRHRSGLCGFNQKGLAVLNLTAYIRPSLGNGRRPNGAGLKGLAKLERLR